MSMQQPVQSQLYGGAEVTPQLRTGRSLKSKQVVEGFVPRPQEFEQLDGRLGGGGDSGGGGGGDSGGGGGGNEGGGLGGKGGG